MKGTHATPWRAARTGRRFVGALAALVLAGGLSACSSQSSPRALLVGTFRGVKGQYSTIQAAVDAAKSGDYVLIAPGDYHEHDDLAHPPSADQASLGEYGGVLVRTPRIRIRGMDRSSVVVDGTKAGAPVPCDSQAGWQELGPAAPGGQHYGTNGIVVYKANEVSIQNLTVCNYLSGTGTSGNEIWWNGGSGTAKIGMNGYWGSYLTATTTYYGGPTVAPTYGIFANDAAGPAGWDHVYASNFDDSGMYVGACQQVCDVTIAEAWMEYNVLGYSGTNSGGAVVIEHSLFDNNQDGLDTNTQIGGDPPPPQNGNCPGGKLSPITHTRSCWVFMDNVVRDNNNSHAPLAPGGYAGIGPVGTGMTVSGGRNDTVMNNTFSGNNGWGILILPFPDTDKPFRGVTCANSGGHELSGFGCVYDPQGVRLLNNTFSGNGGFKNPTNGDYGQIVYFAGGLQNCYAGNIAPDGSTPADLEQTHPPSSCGKIVTATDTGGPLLTQVLCATGFGGCPAGSSYPKASDGVVLHPLPDNLASMPNPCQGAPANAWCKNGRPILGWP